MGDKMKCEHENLVCNIFTIAIDGEGIQCLDCGMIWKYRSGKFVMEER